MSRKIAILNRKGGVGKTAMTVNLGHSLALDGHRVALVDLDPQGHLGTSLGCQAFECGVDNVLLDGCDFSTISNKVRENMDLYPAGNRLLEVEQLRQKGAAGAVLLRDACTDTLKSYDFVLFDCPPSAGVLMSNGLFAVDEVISPVTGDYLALEGLSCVARALQHLHHSLGLVLKHWVALSRINIRRRINEDIFNKVKQYFPRAVFPTIIREAAVLAECPGYGRTIFEYRGHSQSAQEFSAMADDLVLQRTV